MIRRAFMKLLFVAMSALMSKPQWRTPRRVVVERTRTRYSLSSKFHGTVGTVNRSPACGFAAETMVVASWSIGAADDAGNVVERVELRPYRGMRVVDATTGKTTTYFVNRVADWPSFDEFVEVRGA